MLRYEYSAQVEKKKKWELQIYFYKYFFERKIGKIFIFLNGLFRVLNMGFV